MSADEGAAEEEVKAADMMLCCASCGKAEVDDVKLKKCACNIVKYCSVECQKNHRPQHKKACKKRLAEIRDDRLFTQPDESHLGECPICCLLLSLDKGKSSMMACCSKTICNGCCYANHLREIDEGLEHKCPFCREPMPETQKKAKKMAMKRVKVNDPVAICQVGVRCLDGGDYRRAFEYYTKAAGLGDIDSHYELSRLYYEGRSIEKDLKKAVYHLEEAAIGGHHEARFNLGVYEAENERFDRAVKHYIIAAKLGHDKSLKAVKDGFAGGFVSKEDFEVALRGHQASVDATKSAHREEAEKRWCPITC